MTDATPERWLPVLGHDRYDVSDAGRVRSWHPYRGTPVPRIMKPTRDGDGYLTVTLCGTAGRQTWGVHRLVMLAFVGPYPAGHEVRHLDGNPANNDLSNLAYGTRSQNQEDAIAHGTHVKTSKIVCPNGHPYDASTPRDRKGHRRCETCRIARNARRRT